MNVSATWAQLIEPTIKKMNALGITSTAAYTGTGYAGTIPIKREKHEIKCSTCGKVLAEVYSYGEVDSVYCELCHKIEKLKE